MVFFKGLEKHSFVFYFYFTYEINNQNIYKKSTHLKNIHIKYSAKISLKSYNFAMQAVPVPA